MVSALWKACGAGDLDFVNQALSANGVDIEIKDHTGATPLIEAVRNGHVQIVKALLNKGADPTNASSQGSPETYTADATILDMLKSARNERTQDAVVENGYGTNNDPNTYSQPPANYPYYPSINSAPPPDMYYHQPPMENGSSRHNNLPPPEVASAIPCRYFPACRYGSACLFQHPQTSYFQGPLPPPAQYPSSYDQMPPQPYAPSYYPMPPPFPPPPPPQQEMMSLPPQGHFSPNGAPAMSYGPISPMMYAHPGQAPLPMSLPPLHSQPPPPPLPAPQSPQATFNPSSPPAIPPATFVMPPPQYPPNGAVSYPEANGVPTKSPQLNPQPDTSVAGREGPGAGRRGSARRGSFASRKQAPPCIFFPTGRCKNGSECRFPHIMPQEGAVSHPPFYPSRGGAPRPQRNGFTAIDEKLANMSIQENGRVHESATRGRGGKTNVNQGSKRTPLTKQRVPNADEFPVLGGSTTPPARSNPAGLPNGNGHTGPTAAQILQAPRPVRSDSSRGVTPERVKEVKPEMNGTDAHASSPKIPISFAAVATASADVSVAA